MVCERGAFVRGANNDFGGCADYSGGSDYWAAEFSTEDFIFCRPVRATSSGSCFQ